MAPLNRLGNTLPGRRSTDLGAGPACCVRARSGGAAAAAPEAAAAAAAAAQSPSPSRGREEGGGGGGGAGPRGKCGARMGGAGWPHLGGLFTAARESGAVAGSLAGGRGRGWRPEPATPADRGGPAGPAGPGARGGPREGTRVRARSEVSSPGPGKCSALRAAFAPAAER